MHTNHQSRTTVYVYIEVSHPITLHMCFFSRADITLQPSAENCPAVPSTFTSSASCVAILTQCSVSTLPPCNCACAVKGWPVLVDVPFFSRKKAEANKQYVIYGMIRILGCSMVVKEQLFKPLLYIHHSEQTIRRQGSQ